MAIRSTPARAARLDLVALALVLLAACDDVRPATPAPSPSRVAAPASAERNRAMGTGEARNPQPFTIEQRLLEAVRQGDRPTVERALQLGASVAARDDLGRSTVLLAVMDAANLDLVRWLRERGAELDEPDVGGRTALSFAAADGRVEIARYLVANHARIDSRDVQQRTPLMHAALGSHPEVAALLLDAGADVNVRDQFGDTPLIVACAKGNADTAALLLQRGADPAVRDQEGHTAKERSAPEAGPCRSLRE